MDCQIQARSGKFQNLKPDLQKQVLRNHFINNNVPNQTLIMNGQSDVEGGVSPPDLNLQENKRQGKTHPLTSNCNQIPHWSSQHKDGDASHDGLKTVTVQPISPTKAPSRQQKPKIPIIPPQPIRRRRKSYQVVQIDKTKARDESASKAHQELPSTSHVYTPTAVSSPAGSHSKNVQNASEPNIAEKLGLRKGKRRASDQSERSMDRVKELRTRGREVQFESKKRKASIPHTAKYINLKLDPQEAQFHKQKHDQIHKVTATSPIKQTTPWSPKRAKLCVSNGDNHESNEKKGDDDDNDDDDDDDEFDVIEISMQSCDQGCDDESGNKSPTSALLAAHDWDIIVDSSPIFIDLTEDSSETDQQPSSSPQPSASETPTTLHQSGDSLNTPPKSSKTIVKTFTPVSRSDSLVKDMENVPSPKKKTAHQAHTPQAPPPQFKSAQPEIVSPPTAKVNPFSSQADDEQANKTCLEQPPTARREPQAVPYVSARRRKTSILRANILQWKYSWFKKYEQSVPPEALCKQPMKLVRQTFPSLKDYFDTFFPLLLTNTFEELVDKGKWKDRVKLKLAFQSADYDDLHGLNVTNATFKVILTAEEESHQLYPKDSDLVILWLPQNLVSDAHSDASSENRPDDCQPHFGIVSLSEFTGVGGELKLTIETCCGNVSAIDQQLVPCTFVGSLLSPIREFNALCYIDKSDLLHTILEPRKHFLPEPESTAHFLPECESTFDGCSTDQSKAVNCVVSMVMSEQPTPKMCLIHGPPGTGKSSTIVNILYQLSQKLGAADPTGQRHWRILVCAPSITAVDSLMEKIIEFFKRLKSRDGNHQGNCGDVNLVRLGNDTIISKKVEEFSMRHQIRTRIREDSHTNPEQRRSRKQIQKLILQEANIICCTLSSSGSRDLQLAFPSNYHDDTPFNCVIIDEADQAKETETLIPLLFRCPSLVLVGDPLQLVSTVVSQETQGHGFDQSLMARIYKSLDIPNPSYIHFLSQQYRMHPDIQNFPSKHFYKNLLKMNGNIARNRCSSDWICESYRLFDVADGQEMKEKRSYFNQKEVELTVELARLVSKRYRRYNSYKTLEGVIGVIAPNSEQRLQIRRALQEKHLTHVVVSSVDGFQGREMDCVIVSCVRSSEEEEFNGFLGSRQQMNLAITRAKYSLFILGHLHTLKKYRHWKALIIDAESRGFIITTKSQDYESDARKILKTDNSCSFPRPVTPPNQIAHPSYPDVSRDRLDLNDLPPPEYSHYRRSHPASYSRNRTNSNDTQRPEYSDHTRPHEASARMEPYRSTFSRTTRGHYVEDCPSPQQDYSLNEAPSNFWPCRDSYRSYKHDDHRDRRRPWHNY